MAYALHISQLLHNELTHIFDKQAKDKESSQYPGLTQSVTITVPEINTKQLGQLQNLHQAAGGDVSVRRSGKDVRISFYAPA